MIIDTDIQQYLSDDELAECKRIEGLLHFTMVSAIEKAVSNPAARFGMAFYITQSMHKKAYDFVGGLK